MAITFRKKTTAASNGNGAASAAAAAAAALPEGASPPPSTSTSASASAPAASTSAPPRSSSASSAPIVIDYVGDAAKAAQASTRPLADLVFVFHLCAFLWFSRVWAWHLGAQASKLPGSKGFGWFFRYLTFCSFTAQTATLALCCAAHLSMRARVARAVAEGKERRRKGEGEEKEEKRSNGVGSSRSNGSNSNGPSPLPSLPPSSSSATPSSSSPLWLSRAADDAACAIFGLANVVTLMYYAIERSQKGNLVEGGGAARPAWLGAAVHSLNAVVAWTDLLLAHPRSFSPRSARASAALALLYCHWLLLVRRVTGAFPYPILNKMPMPSGFVFLIGSGLVLFWVLFRAGKRISSPLLRYKTRFGWPAE